MGIGSFLFGQKGGFEKFDNPYINELANLQGAGFKGPRQYYRSILQGFNKGDYSKLPGMGMFDSEIAKQTRAIDETANPLAYTSAGEAGGPLAERVRELRKQQATEAINNQRFGFAQNALGQAAEGLTNISNLKQQFNLSKLGTAAGLFNQTHVYRPPTQGAFGGLLGSLGSAGLAAATGGASLAATSATGWGGNKYAR